MRLLSKLFNKQPDQLVRKEILPVNWPIDQGSFLEYAFSGGVLPPRKAMGFYRTNSTVATAIDMISDACVGIRPVLQDKSGKFIESHDVLSLLAQPNGFEPYLEFARKMFNHYLITHNSHVAAFGRLGSKPLELHAVKPMHVNPTPDTKDGYAKSYNVTSGIASGSYGRFRNGRSLIRYTDGGLKELYHIMGFSSSGSDLWGDSPLAAAALETRQQIKGRVHNLSVLEKGGRLSLIVTFKDPSASEDEMRARKNAINENLGGATNAGGIAVINGEDTAIHTVTSTNKDMDYADLDKIAGQAIYLRYGIPLPLVSLDASTYNNLEQAIIYFYESKVLPTCNTLFGGLTKFLLPRFGLDPSDYKITYNPEEIEPLMNKTLTEIERRKKINIETTNELRALLPGREPVDGGDILYQNATLIPIGTDLYTDDNIQTAEEQAAELLRQRNG